MSPSDLEVQLQRVNTLTSKHDYVAALPALNAVIKSHPQLGNLRVGRAQIEMRLGQTSEAQADFDAARNEKGAEATSASALCLGEINVSADPGSTLQDCSRAVIAAPADATLLASRAVAAHRMKLDAQAAADVLAAHKLAKNDARQLNGACYALAQSDFALPDALLLYDEALRIMPNAPAVLDSRAFTLLRMNRNSEAVATYSAALKLMPKFALALYGRALAEKRLGQQRESDKDKAAAVAVLPSVGDVFSDMGVSFPG